MIHKDILDIVKKYIYDYCPEMKLTNALTFFAAYGHDCLNNEMYVSESFQIMNMLDDSYESCYELDAEENVKSLRKDGRVPIRVKVTNPKLIDLKPDEIYQSIIAACLTLELYIDLYSFWTTGE